METITVEIHWEDKNYACAWAMEGIGAVIATNKALDGLKAAFAESMREHVACLVADGDDVPQWLANGDYQINYTLHTSALLREAENYTTMAAISRATGINQKQLSHYASSVKNPRPEQRKRIVDGLHLIGQKFLSLC